MSHDLAGSLQNPARREASRARGIEVRRKLKALLIPSAALLVLIGLISAVRSDFLSARVLAMFAIDAAPMLMLVIGQSVVILTGAIDLSVATMASFAAVLFVLTHPVIGDWSLVLVALLAALIGTTQGYIHVKAQIPSFVVTFGTQAMLYGITFYMSGSTAAPLAGPSRVIDQLGGRIGTVPNGMTIVLVSAGLLALLFRFTRLGRDIYAVGASERAALIAGVKVMRVKMLVFAISAVYASMTGLLLLAQTSYSSPGMANNYLLPAIVGVVVGGTAISGGVGGIGCAILGGLIATAVRIGTVIVGLNPAFQNIVFGAVIVAVVAVTIDRQKIGIIK